MGIENARRRYTYDGSRGWVGDWVRRKRPLNKIRRSTIRFGGHVCESVKKRGRKKEWKKEREREWQWKRENEGINKEKVCICVCVIRGEKVYEWKSVCKRERVRTKEKERSSYECAGIIGFVEQLSFLTLIGGNTFALVLASWPFTDARDIHERRRTDWARFSRARSRVMESASCSGCGDSACRIDLHI